MSGVLKHGIKHKKRVTGKIARPVRVATPEYSPHSLYDHMKDYINKYGIKGSLDFQAYKSIKLSCAVSGRGLIQNKNFIQMLINVCPFAIFKNLDLQTCFKQMGNLFDELVGMHHRSVDRWAMELSERTMVMLNHVRRLRNSDIRLRQACSKLDDASVRALKNLVNQIIPSDEIVPMAVDKGLLALCDKEDAEGLADHHSDVASDGLEALLDAEPVPPAKKLAVPKAKCPAGDKKAACSSGGSAGLGADVKFYVTYATLQSYIQFTSATQKKKKLLVGVSSVMSPKHKNVVKVMHRYLLEHPSTSKEVALDLRAALLK